MRVRVEREVLTPRVQNRHAAQLRTQLSVAYFQQRLAGSSQELGVEDLGTVQRDRVQRFGTVNTT